MIITITGKPCSGKGTVSKEFCKKYGFEYVCTGDMFRAMAKEMGYDNILTFQKEHKDIKKVDKLIDDKIEEIGKTSLDKNIVIDSRLAWNFIPNSFKVFIDVNESEAAKRLLEANRDTEKISTITEAKRVLKDRWDTENDRYMQLYGVNNLNKKNYHYIINSTKLEPQQIISKIYKKYQKFMKKREKTIKNNKKY